MTFTPDELRLIGLAGHTWISMLESRAEQITARMLMEFRGGKTDHLASIAELATVRDQISELKSALNQNAKQRE